MFAYLDSQIPLEGVVLSSSDEENFIESRKHPDTVKKYDTNDITTSTPISETFFNTLIHILQQEESCISVRVTKHLANVLGHSAVQSTASAALINSVLGLLNNPPGWMSSDIQKELVNGLKKGLANALPSNQILEKLLQILEVSCGEMSCDIQIALAQGIKEGLFRIIPNDQVLQSVLKLLQRKILLISKEAKIELADGLGVGLSRGYPSDELLQDTLKFLKNSVMQTPLEIQKKLADGLGYGLMSFGSPNDEFLREVLDLLQEAPNKDLNEIQEALIDGLGEGYNDNDPTYRSNDKVLLEVFKLLRLPSSTMSQELQLKLAEKLTEDLSFYEPTDVSREEVLWTLLNVLQTPSQLQWAQEELLVQIAQGLGAILIRRTSSRQLLEEVFKFLQVPSQELSSELQQRLKNALAEGLGDTSYTDDISNNELLKKIMSLLRTSTDNMSIELKKNLVDAFANNLEFNILDREALNETLLFLQTLTSWISPESENVLFKNLGKSLCNSMVGEKLLGSDTLGVLQKAIKWMSPKALEALIKGLLANMSVSNCELLEFMVRLLDTLPLPDIKRTLVEELVMNFFPMALNKEIVEAILALLEAPPSWMLQKDTTEMVQEDITEKLAKKLGESLAFNKLSCSVLDIILLFLKGQGEDKVSKVQIVLASGLGRGLKGGAISHDLLKRVFECLLESPFSQSLPAEVQLALGRGLIVNLSDEMDLYNKDLFDEFLRDMLLLWQKSPKWMSQEVKEQLAEWLNSVLCESSLSLSFLIALLKEREISHFVLPVILVKAREDSIAMWISDSKIHFIENNTQHEIEIAQCMINKLRDYLKESHHIYKDDDYAEEYFNAVEEALKADESNKASAYYQEGLMLATTDDLDDADRQEIDEAPCFSSSVAPSRFFNQPPAINSLIEEELQVLFNGKEEDITTWEDFTKPVTANTLECVQHYFAAEVYFSNCDREKEIERLGTPLYEKIERMREYYLAECEAIEREKSTLSLS
ncbi:MAG: hypothetical protein ACX932_06935 [Gammaproteobacteria bacterium]